LFIHRVLSQTREGKNMRSTIGILLFISVIGTLGCDPKSTSSQENKQVVAVDDKVKETSTQSADKKEDAPDSVSVTVTKDGSKFDPPVTIDTLPDGAFYCDMGKSHYARMEKGDNKCPLCGMALKHKGSAAKDDHGDHEGHEH
jgi:hypothetical protein